MKLAIDLTDQQATELEHRARELGLTSEDLARAAVVNLVAQSAEDFEAVSERVLAKNRELYRRLS